MTDRTAGFAVMVNGWLRWQTVVRKNPGLCPVAGSHDQKNGPRLLQGVRLSRSQPRWDGSWVFDISPGDRSRIRCGGCSGLLGGRMEHGPSAEHARVDNASSGFLPWPAITSPADQSDLPFAVKDGQGRCKTLCRSRIPIWKGHRASGLGRLN